MKFIREDYNIIHRVVQGSVDGIVPRLRIYITSRFFHIKSWIPSTFKIKAAIQSDDIRGIPICTGESVIFP